MVTNMDADAQVPALYVEEVDRAAAAAEDPHLLVGPASAQGLNSDVHHLRRFLICRVATDSSGGQVFKLPGCDPQVPALLRLSMHTLRRLCCAACLLSTGHEPPEPCCRS